MATTAPTFSQIRAQVAAIRRKLPEARVIGIRAPGRWTGERIKRHGEETYLIEQCDSPLALRIALERGRRTDDNEGPDHEPRREAIERRHTRPTRQAKVVSRSTPGRSSSRSFRPMRSIRG